MHFALILTIADQAGLSPAQLALAWIMRQPNVASAIIGATRPEQVAENAAAAAAGVTGTPALFIDGRSVDITTLTPDSLTTQIEEAARP